MTTLTPRDQETFDRLRLAFEERRLPMYAIKVALRGADDWTALSSAIQEAGIEARDDRPYRSPWDSVFGAE